MYGLELSCTTIPWDSAVVLRICYLFFSFLRRLGYPCQISDSAVRSLSKIFGFEDCALVFLKKKSKERVDAPAQSYCYRYAEKYCYKKWKKKVVKMHVFCVKYATPTTLLLARHSTSTTVGARSKHTFSAFWLRSSVVSVLISLISGTSTNVGMMIKCFFVALGWSARWSPLGSDGLHISVRPQQPVIHHSYNQNYFFSKSSVPASFVADWINFLATFCIFKILK